MSLRLDSLPVIAAVTDGRVRCRAGQAGRLCGRRRQADEPDGHDAADALDGAAPSAPGALRRSTASREQSPLRQDPGTSEEAQSPDEDFSAAAEALRAR
jgi:hypothetical protein